MTTLFSLILRVLASGLLVVLTWTTPRTWVPGELVTASMLNTHVRDNLNAVKGFIPTGFSGLHLRTHPDADKAANQIALLALDQVVMNDGMRYSGLSSILPLTADITVSGAGGLDTGARAASTWYEPYLIGKSSTGAVADLQLMFHRAKDYKLDQFQTTNAGNVTLRGATTAKIKIAQSFQPGTTGLVERVDLQLIRTSSAPTGRVWITLEADSAGAPSGTPLATSDKLNAGIISTTVQSIALAFRSPVSLTAGTTYWIVLQGDYTQSDTLNIAVGVNTAGGYASGQEAYYDGTTWTNVSANDLWFKTYVTENDTALSMPAGYDQYCQLAAGFFNNASNVFDGLIYRDRQATPLTIDNSFGSTSSLIPTLFGLSSWLPPMRVRAWATLANNTGSDGISIGGAPDGFAMDALRTRGGVRVYPAVAGNGTTGDVWFYTEMQACYMKAEGGGTASGFISGFEW